jgi:hypothetical protein
VVASPPVVKDPPSTPPVVAVPAMPVVPTVPVESTGEGEHLGGVPWQVSVATQHSPVSPGVHVPYLIACILVGLDSYYKTVA